MNMKRALVSAAVVLLLALVALTTYALVPPAGSRSIREFDPPRLANLEVRMWQAYYDKKRATLFALLVTMLHEQYRYSWAKAATEGYHLARAASRFGDLRSNYESVLPDLEAAYGAARSWLDAGFDPQAVAHAELMWWVARRIPGANAPDQVGELMADEYALLYEAPRELVTRAALLRAEAGALRDASAAQPDWIEIERLLRESYVELFGALHARFATRTLVPAGS
jgi:hypothetical protein